MGSSILAKASQRRSSRGQPAPAAEKFSGLHRDRSLPANRRLLAGEAPLV